MTIIALYGIIIEGEPEELDRFKESTLENFYIHHIKLLARGLADDIVQKERTLRILEAKIGK